MPLSVILEWQLAYFCFKNDVSILLRVNEIHDLLTSELDDRIEDRNLKTQCVF